MAQQQQQQQQMQQLPSLPPQPKVVSARSLSKDSDTLLNETMNRLSLKEREQVYEDVHGVSDLIEEEPQFVNEKLRQMENIIRNYCGGGGGGGFSNSSSSSSGDVSSGENNDNNHNDNHNHNHNHNHNNNHNNNNGISTAYQLALSKNPKYCTNRQFRIQFLRSVSFDSKSAAIRYMKFFQIKLELFGEDKLVKPHICQSDLSPSDLRCLEGGCYQLLPQRDSSERSVALGVPYYQKSHSTESVARALWYVGMRCFFDEETQKRGMVAIVWRTGKMTYGSNLETIWYGSKILEGLPMRFVSVHMCLSHDPFMETAMKTALAFQSMSFQDSLRTRLRGHMGTVMECLYKLMAFGIPTKLIPFSRGGSADSALKQHRDFLKRQKALETNLLNVGDVDGGSGTTSDGSGSRGAVVVVPGNDDVLTMGRKTKTIRSFPGNIKFRSIIEAYMDEYDGHFRVGRMALSKLIVSKINQSGSKFLNHEEIGWVEMSDDEARDKVTHAFRNLRMSKKSTPTTAAAASATSSSLTIPPDPCRNNNGSPRMTMMAVEDSIFRSYNTNSTTAEQQRSTATSSVSSILSSQTLQYSDDDDDQRSCFIGCKRRKILVR